MRQGLAIIVMVMATTSAALAHGGMAGPDELGPPLFTSAALAFICYWVVIFWPASKRGKYDGAPNRKDSVEGKRQSLPKQTYKRGTPRQTPLLRKVGSTRARGGFETERKASDA